MSHLASKPAKGSVELSDAIRHCSSALRVVLLFSMAINLLMLVPSIYMLQVMDRVIGTGHLETLAALSALAAGGALVMSVLDTLRSSVSVRVGGWLNDRLGPVLLESGVRARLKGDAIGGQTLRDLSTLQSFIANHGAVAFFDTPWVPVFLILIWLLHPLLGMVALLSAVLLFTLSLVNDWVTRRSTKTAMIAQIESGRLADATFRNAEAVSAMGMLPAMTERWQRYNLSATDALRDAGEAGGVVLAITKFVRTSVQMAILGVGAFLVIENHISAGAMIAASIMLGRALAPVEMLIGVWKVFTETRLAYDRLKSHLDEHPKEPKRTSLPRPSGLVEVEKLIFSVGGRPIIKDVSFTMLPGEAIAVIGPSGAGKSTLCRLLVGLGTPDSGKILLDGSSLRHHNPEELGRSIGFLPQDVELFEGTVKENISRMTIASDDDVIAAAMLARAHSLIQGLPDGYDTRIGDGGVRLSGGQRQRVGLARAVYGQPCLVILDEPNANLDQAGESALAEAISDLKARGASLLIVGHRPSTLAQADKILLMKDGTGIMFGPRDEVLNALSASAAQQSANADAIPMRKTSQGADASH